MRLLLVLALLALAPTPALAQRYRDDGGGRVPWYGLRLGGLFATKSLVGNTPSAGGAGAYVLFDARDFLADVSADAFFGPDARLFAAGLGAYYPFLPGNVTPYAGGGLKLAWTSFGGDGAFGLIPFVAGGVLVGRHWYPQIRVEVGWFLAAAREAKGGVGDGVRSNGPMGTFGLAF
jgi:hypothetical protein